MIVNVREATKEDYSAIVPIASESQEKHREKRGQDAFRKNTYNLPLAIRLSLG